MADYLILAKNPQKWQNTAVPFNNLPESDDLIWQYSVESSLGGVLIQWPIDSQQVIKDLTK